MKKYSVWMVALLAAGFVLTAAPKDADAALRLGADGLWMPLAFQNIETEEANAELDSDHDLASFGVSAHGNLGFDIFAIGLKLNYFNQAISFADGDDRFEELDINLMARVGIPTTDIAFFAEAGPTTSPGFDYFGYNVGGGVEYDLIGLPLIDLNLGAMGQYVNVSDVDFSINGVEETASVNEGRVMLFLGVDFSI
ncbi:hypothetical protein FIV42_14815 [Persicimonas caeni]|uniref:Outer membrane protein beta-barrel domain-containing protein n=1 Tax=Persicimonas caeni TaxID=2292766 RepID=A0A4Y6PUD8_PERCE|nr:hypothetical protein [Persicimonas caeni]QDG51964.1 hypothetical protein FIV42_14815 [Persicimonas caeni]QED33185.1 hypothetical protein FRD00_14810 [Persicimonas caeni]